MTEYCAKDCHGICKSTRISRNDIVMFIGVEKRIVGFFRITVIAVMDHYSNVIFTEGVIEPDKNRSFIFFLPTDSTNASTFSAIALESNENLATVW